MSDHRDFAFRRTSSEGYSGVSAKVRWAGEIAEFSDIRGIDNGENQPTIKGGRLNSMRIALVRPTSRVYPLLSSSIFVLKIRSGFP